ncbi:hypothetical protein [Enterobacter hormaechei]|uniref:hypothetical protein n=1 Tax=Enterobacter hormaechei TaxID=158836 RepID=UPI003F44141C
MTIKIIGCTSIGNGVDGISIVTDGHSDVHIEDVDVSGNKRHGISVDKKFGLLYSAGIISETPEKLLYQAYEELTRSHDKSEANQVKVLKSIGLDKYIAKGANLATIAGLLIQIFGGK